MRVGDVIAEIMKRERINMLFVYPVTPLTDTRRLRIFVPSSSVRRASDARWLMPVAASSSDDVKANAWPELRACRRVAQASPELRRCTSIPTSVWPAATAPMSARWARSISIPLIKRAKVNLDECVECYACFNGMSQEHLNPTMVRTMRKLFQFMRLRFDPEPDVCPTAAFEPEELTWPRVVRRAFSDPRVPHDPPASKAAAPKK